MIAPSQELASSVIFRVVTPTGLREFQFEPPHSQVSAELTALLRGRHLWREVPTTVELISRLCRQVLQEHLGLTDADLEIVATSGNVEVSIDQTLEEARDFPWEFLIAEGTREWRRRGAGHRLLVRRHLAGLEEVPVAPPRSALVVESAPGYLGEIYSFDKERRVVLSSLNLPGPDPLVNPDASQLKETLLHNEPDILHLTAIDSIQGASLLNVAPKDPGIYFRDGSAAVVIPYEKLARLVTAGSHKPIFVAFNLYNSAPVAAKVVELGIDTAIGFQDEIDDAVAELFFAVLYSRWRSSGWNLAESYREAWVQLAPHAPRLRGTGIVLWSRRSFFDPTGTQQAVAKHLEPPEVEPGPRRGRKRRAQPAPLVETFSVPAAPSEERTVQSLASQPAVEEPVAITYSPPKRLNYSLLHNNRPLFDEFIIRRVQPGSYLCTVEVALHSGLETARYQASFTLDDRTPIVDVNEHARVSLTSELARSLAESVYTGMYVHVRTGDRTLYQHTERVELLPIDEWKDDDLNRQWLPSFVLPRDSAVRQIVDTAQRYLVALADDAGAGFDGYQSYNPEGQSLDERCRGTDWQVQALWWALITDFPLSYVNPPPTFSAASQRLRTPSDVLNGRRGTCIDLTLLLAACLEYVEIYPVIFLLSDHAFPGYCRGQESHDLIRKQFTAVQPDATRVSPLSREERTVQKEWILPVDRYGEVMRLVQAGYIVPLETVALTQRTGFWPAVEEGLQNLRSRTYFESMFDVRLAREAKVTPLPIGSVRP